MSQGDAAPAVFDLTDDNKGKGEETQALPGKRKALRKPDGRAIRNFVHGQHSTSAISPRDFEKALKKARSMPNPSPIAEKIIAYAQQEERKQQDAAALKEPFVNPHTVLQGCGSNLELGASILQVGKAMKSAQQRRDDDANLKDYAGREDGDYLSFLTKLANSLSRPPLRNSTFRPQIRQTEGGFPPSKTRSAL